jgi:integrase
MATVRKRGNGYQIDYFDPTGKRVRKSFKKKKDAEAELGKRVSLIAEGRYLDVKKDFKTTLDALIEVYSENFQSQSNFRMKLKYFRNFKEYFGKDCLLSNIRYVDVETYRNHLRKKLTQHGTIRTDASINREMSALRHLFKKGVKWDMLEKSPFDNGDTLILKENNKRHRYLEADEMERLFAECPLYLRRIVECALHTGMRKSEILRLKWEQVRNGFIYLRDYTKDKESRQLPINDDLQDIFTAIRREQHLTSEHVFLYEGRPVRDIKTAFNAACKRAGVKDFHFHDLRHTFASYVVMKGGSLKDVQELLGHSTMRMTLRYSHLSQRHKRNAVNLLNGITKRVDCHKTVTFPPHEEHASL